MTGTGPADPTVEVALSTHNGARWLPEMLASLAAQTRDDFVLRVRDDGSTDETLEILRAARDTFGDRLIVDPDRAPSGSAKAGFARLLDRVDGDIVLFADQDDVWTDDHVERIAGLIAAEGAANPVCAFTDLQVVDASLDTLADSFFAWKDTPPTIVHDLPAFAVASPICGCASGVNRAALRLGLPMPQDRVAMHDWWLGLLCAAAGRVVWSDHPTVRYRQHGANASAQVGATASVLGRARGARAKMRHGLRVKAGQAEAVAERLRERGLAQDRADILAGFASALSRPPGLRQSALIRGGYLYPDWRRRAAQLLFA